MLQPCSYPAHWALAVGGAPSPDGGPAPWRRSSQPPKNTAAAIQSLIAECAAPLSCPPPDSLEMSLEWQRGRPPPAGSILKHTPASGSTSVPADSAFHPVNILLTPVSATRYQDPPGAARATLVHAITL